MKKLLAVAALGALVVLGACGGSETKAKRPQGVHRASCASDAAHAPYPTCDLNGKPMSPIVRWAEPDETAALNVIEHTPSLANINEHCILRVWETYFPSLQAADLAAAAHNPEFTDATADVRDLCR